MKKVILTYGTFDLFHVGHVRLLERLRLMGDELYVGLSTDEFNLSKGKQSVFSYEERYEILTSCKFVDFVFPEESWEQKIIDIQKYSANIFAMGDDWQGKFDFLSQFCEVCYLERTEYVSTTGIKNSLAKYGSSEIEKIEKSVVEALRLLQELNRDIC